MQKQLTEAAGAATLHQHRAVAELVVMPSGFAIKTLLAVIRTRVHIQLGAIEQVLLKHEALGIIFDWGEEMYAS